MNLFAAITCAAALLFRNSQNDPPVSSSVCAPPTDIDFQSAHHAVSLLNDASDATALAQLMETLSCDEQNGLIDVFSMNFNQDDIRLRLVRESITDSCPIYPRPMAPSRAMNRVPPRMVIVAPHHLRNFAAGLRRGSASDAATDGRVSSLHSQDDEHSAVVRRTDGVSEQDIPLNESTVVPSGAPTFMSTRSTCKDYYYLAYYWCQSSPSCYNFFWCPEVDCNNINCNDFNTQKCEDSKCLNYGDCRWWYCDPDYVCADDSKCLSYDSVAVDACRATYCSTFDSSAPECAGFFTSMIDCYISKPSQQPTSHPSISMEPTVSFSPSAAPVVVDYARCRLFHCAYGYDDVYNCPGVNFPSIDCTLSPAEEESCKNYYCKNNFCDSGRCFKTNCTSTYTCDDYNAQKCKDSMCLSYGTCVYFSCPNSVCYSPSECDAYNATKVDACHNAFCTTYNYEAPSCSGYIFDTMYCSVSRPTYSPTLVPGTSLEPTIHFDPSFAPSAAPVVVNYAQCRLYHCAYGYDDVNNCPGVNFNSMDCSLTPSEKLTCMGQYCTFNSCPTYYCYQTNCDQELDCADYNSQKCLDTMCLNYGVCSSYNCPNSVCPSASSCDSYNATAIDACRSAYCSTYDSSTPSCSGFIASYIDCYLGKPSPSPTFVPGATRQPTVYVSPSRVPTNAPVFVDYAQCRLYHCAYNYDDSYNCPGVNFTAIDCSLTPTERQECTDFYCNYNYCYSLYCMGSNCTTAIQCAVNPTGSPVSAPVAGPPTFSPVSYPVGEAPTYSPASSPVAGSPTYAPVSYPFAGSPTFQPGPNPTQAPNDNSAYCRVYWCAYDNAMLCTGIDTSTINCTMTATERAQCIGNYCYNNGDCNPYFCFKTNCTEEVQCPTPPTPMPSINGSSDNGNSSSGMNVKMIIVPVGSCTTGDQGCIMMLSLMAVMYGLALNRAFWARRRNGFRVNAMVEPEGMFRMVDNVSAFVFNRNAVEVAAANQALRLEQAARAAQSNPSGETLTSRFISAVGRQFIKADDTESQSSVTLQRKSTRSKSSVGPKATSSQRLDRDDSNE